MRRLPTKLAAALRRLRRRLSGGDAGTIRAYLEEEGVRKLHLGCGKHVLDGWLNADLDPGAKGLVHVDASGRFPFGDETFRYVFSEHMIEHLPHQDGLRMLQECHRVLKPGGRIRLSTPDLAFLIDLARNDPSDLQKRYLEWATKEHVRNAPYAGPAFVINNFVRDWGHRFIYDEKTLRHSVEAAGFVDLTRYDLNESDDDALRDLENEQRMPSGFLTLESLTLEGTKAVRQSRP